MLTPHPLLFLLMRFVHRNALFAAVKCRDWHLFSVHIAQMGLFNNPFCWGFLFLSLSNYFIY